MKFLVTHYPQTSLVWWRQSCYGPVSLFMLSSNSFSFYFVSCRENQHALSPLSSYTEMVRLLCLEAEWSEGTRGLALGQMDLELLSSYRCKEAILNHSGTLDPAWPGLPEDLFNRLFPLGTRGWVSIRLASLETEASRFLLLSTVCKPLNSLPLTLLLTHHCMFVFHRPWCEIQSIAAAPLGSLCFWPS